MPGSNDRIIAIALILCFGKGTPLRPDGYILRILALTGYLSSMRLVKA